MNRKNIFLVTIVTLVIVLGIGTYFLLKRTPSPTPIPTPVFPGEGRIPVGGTTPTTSTTGGEGAFTPGSGAPLPRLYELHHTPVAGAGFIESGKGADHAIFARYIERGLGHIYETHLSTLAESRIVSETRSRLSEAFWGNGGKSVVVRSFDDKAGLIKTLVLNIGNSTTSFTRSTSTPATNQLLQTEEVSLPNYIPFAAVAEDGSDKLFYLENGPSSAIGSISNFKSIGSSILNTSVTEWLPQFPNQKLVTLTTRPSTNVPGHLFFLDTKTKALTKILGGLKGLTTLTSHDGTTVLYADIVDGAPELSFYNVKNGSSTSLALRTLPEKCAWGTKNPSVAYCAVPQTIYAAQSPDQWYQGLVSFSDSIWLVDTKTARTQKILVPNELGAPSLDIISPSLSLGDEYFLFMNKVTGTPWVYRIAEDTPITPIPTTPQALPPSTTSTSSVPTSAATPSPSLSGMVKIK